MTRDDIIKLAREVAHPETEDPVNDGLVTLTLDEFEAFFHAAYAAGAAAERERLHDKFMAIHKSQQHSNNYWHFAARKIKEEA